MDRVLTRRLPASARQSLKTKKQDCCRLSGHASKHAHTLEGSMRRLLARIGNEYHSGSLPSRRMISTVLECGEAQLLFSIECTPPQLKYLDLFFRV